MASLEQGIKPPAAAQALWQLSALGAFSAKGQKIDVEGFGLGLGGTATSLPLLKIFHFDKHLHVFPHSPD